MTEGVPTIAPEALVRFVTEACPSAAAGWLGSLSDVVSALSAHWGLSDVVVHPASQRSLVASCEHAVHGRSYLKVERPGVLLTSPVALEAWAWSGGGPEVLAVDVERGAYLMTAVPGRPLTWCDPFSVQNTPVVTSLLLAGRERFASRAPVSGIPPLDLVAGSAVRTAAERLARLPEDTAAPFDPQLLERDGRQCLDVPRHGGLLHGDLAPSNVLGSGPAHGPVTRLSFIDPEPVLGPLEWDVATWCGRADLSGRMGEHLAAVRSVTAFDEPLMAWFLSFQARTYIAYRLAFGREIPDALVEAALL